MAALTRACPGGPLFQGVFCPCEHSYFLSKSCITSCSVHRLLLAQGGRSSLCSRELLGAPKPALIGVRSTRTRRSPRRSVSMYLAFPIATKKAPAPRGGRSAENRMNSRGARPSGRSQTSSSKPPRLPRVEEAKASAPRKRGARPLRLSLRGGGRGSLAPFHPAPIPHPAAGRPVPWLPCGPSTSGAARAAPSPSPSDNQSFQLTCEKTRDSSDLQ